MCFNPRPRVGGDVRVLPVLVLPRIVSIHAPAWGATSVTWLLPSMYRCFNPRPRVGGDCYSGE